MFRLILGHLAHFWPFGATRSPTPQGWGINWATKASTCRQSPSPLECFIYSIRRRDPAYFNPYWWQFSNPCLQGEWGQKQALCPILLGVRPALLGT